MLIISGSLARDPELKKVVVDGKKRFVLDNCVFVKGKGKDQVPVNITAWDKNATYIAENFEKREMINLIGIEKLDNIMIDKKTYGICTFTVIKIIDKKIYRAITGILSALISRIINCSDVGAENILSLELMLKRDKGETDQDTEEEKVSASDEENIINNESLDDKSEDDLFEDLLKDTSIDTPPDESSEIAIEEAVPAVLDDQDGDGVDHEAYKVQDQEDLSIEDDPVDEWIPAREPSNYYVLDFSYIKKENYHN